MPFLAHKKIAPIICSVLLLLLVSSMKTYALDLFPSLGGQRAGTSVFTFLKIGVGARSTGMGNSGVSLARDAATLYWNPAAAAQLGRNSLTVSHMRWLVDIQYNYLGYIQKVSKNIYLGISTGALYTDPMEVTTVYHPYGSGEYFNFGDIFFGLTFSQKMTDRFSYGFTIKYVEETLADLDMKSAMMDLGTFYWTGFKTLRFCVSLVNFGPQSRPAGTYDKPIQEGGVEAAQYTLFSPPTEFRIGAAMDVLEFNQTKTLFSCQLNHPVDNKENFVIGVEQNVADLLFLRAGWMGAQKERNYTTGLGLNIPLGTIRFTADYAWSDFGVLGDVQRIQMSLLF